MSSKARSPPLQQTGQPIEPPSPKLQSGEASTTSTSGSRPGPDQSDGPMDVSQWKAQFLSKPSISTRKGIAFGHDPPSEDTSTLVLTAPSGKFIDIRIPRQVSYTDRGRAVSIREHPSYWAFSGTSSTTFYDAQDLMRPGFSFTAHTTFEHVIDSKGPGIVDEGDCFLLPNGDVMETGIWHETGQLYKECWTSPEILPHRSSIVLGPVVVMEKEDDADGRGIIIRIGDYIQSLLEVKHAQDSINRVCIARLVRDDTSAKKKEGNVVYDRMYDRNIDGAWILDARMLPLFVSEELHLKIPSHKAAARGITKGDKFEWNGAVWKITEYVE